LRIVSVIWPRSISTTMPREMPRTIMTPTCEVRTSKIAIEFLRLMMKQNLENLFDNVQVHHGIELLMLFIIVPCFVMSYEIPRRFMMPTCSGLKNQHLL
jgi:hypothetical protein